MKFVCPSCKAKYQIADEKIHGRTLKMDCRRCNTQITIRGDLPAAADELEVGEARPASVRPGAPQPAGARRPTTGSQSNAPAARRPSPASSAPGQQGASTALGSSALGSSALGADFRRGSIAPEARPPEPRTSVLDQWHVAINDVPVGPMRREEVSRKIATGAVNAESLAWREGFDDWRPVRDIPELAALLRRAEPAARVPHPTAPRPAGKGLASAPSSRLASRPAAAGAALNRGNVVPIGGRLGGAAPAFDEEPEEGQEEPTQIASAADLGLAGFGDASAKEEPKGKTAARAPIPSPSRQAPAKVASPSAASAGRISSPGPAPAAKVSAPLALPPARDDDGLPPLEEPVPSLANFAPAPQPLAITAPAPTAAPVQAQPERRRGLPVGAWMGIAGAIAFGAVFAFVIAQRMVPAPTPAPAPAAAAAAITPAAPTARTDELVDPVPPPAPEVAPEIDPAAEVPPAEPESGTAVGPHRRTGTGSTTATGTGTTGTGGGAATKAPNPDFARFSDEPGAAGPAAIGGEATTRRLGDSAASATAAELTADQISHVVTRERSGLQRCWETAIRGLRETPTVRMDVDLTIGGSGTVTSAAARGPSMGSLSDCIERSVRRWRFPAAGGVSRTSFPVVFTGTN